MTARTRTCGPLAAACLIALMFAATSQGTAVADTASTVGWVRLAQLSPNTPPADMYVYPSGGTAAAPVLKYAAYGTLSPYESLTPGSYLVAVRDAGTAVTTNPVISVQVNVTAGQAYTAAALGPASALTLQVLSDKLDTAPDKASVRVIEASLRNPAVSVNAGGNPVAANLSFPKATGYQTLTPGPSTVKVTTQADNATTQLKLNFAAGSTYTLAVLDGAGSSPQILDLNDATGMGTPPKGGVSTGFGGTAHAANAENTAHTAQQGGGANVLPAGSILLAIIAVGAVVFATSRRRK